MRLQQGKVYRHPETGNTIEKVPWGFIVRDKDGNKIGHRSTKAAALKLLTRKKNAGPAERRYCERLLAEGSSGGSALQPLSRMNVAGEVERLKVYIPGQGETVVRGVQRGRDWYYEDGSPIEVGGAEVWEVMGYRDNPAELGYEHTAQGWYVTNKTDPYRHISGIPSGPFASKEDAETVGHARLQGAGGSVDDILRKAAGGGAYSLHYQMTEPQHRQRNPTTGPAVSPSGRGHMHEYRCNPDLDTEAVDELKLYIDNDGDLYRRQTSAVLKNLSRKWKAGTYNEALAAKAFGYVAESGAKKYVKEFGGGTWHAIFPKAVRDEVARQMAKEFTVEAELGNLHENPTSGMTAKGRRMERDIKRAGSAAAPSAVVYAAAKRGVPGLVTKKWAKEHGYPKPNPFMVPQYAKGTAWEVETGQGTEMVLSDLLPTEGFYKGQIYDADDVDTSVLNALSQYLEAGGDIYTVEVVEGWFAHLSAPGYMDQTEWAGPFDTKKEAYDYIEDAFEVDPETGEPLED